MHCTISGWRIAPLESAMMINYEICYIAIYNYDSKNGMFVHINAL